MIKSNMYYIQELKEAWNKEKGTISVKEFCDKNGISKTYFYARLMCDRKDDGNKNNGEYIDRIKISAEEKEEIKKFYNEKDMDFEEIAKLKGYPILQVEDILMPEWEKKQLNKFWESRDNLYRMNIEDMIGKKYTCREISDLISVSIGAVREFVQSKGYRHVY